MSRGLLPISVDFSSQPSPGSSVPIYSCSVHLVGAEYCETISNYCRCTEGLKHACSVHCERASCKIRDSSLVIHHSSMLISTPFHPDTYHHLMLQAIWPPQWGHRTVQWVLWSLGSEEREGHHPSWSIQTQQNLKLTNCPWNSAIFDKPMRQY